MQPAEKFVPNYYRLESHLRESIRGGALKPGNPIPPESHLGRQFSVSRTTVRQALARRHIGEALTPDEIHNQPLVPAVRRILGKPRTRLTLRVTASVARRNEARVLETRVGAPVLVREHTWHYDPEGPLQYGKSVFRGDRYQMLVDFTATPHGQTGAQ